MKLVQIAYVHANRVHFFNFFLLYEYTQQSIHVKTEVYFVFNIKKVILWWRQCWSHSQLIYWSPKGVYHSRWKLSINILIHLNNLFA